MEKFLTLDVGTTAVKVGLFRRDFTPVGFVIKEYSLLTPEEDIVELDPSVYWENSVRGIRQVLDESGTDPNDVVSITCTTQGETMIPVDVDGNTLYNAIVWLDARAKEECSYIAKKFSREKFYSKTGLPEVTPYCPIAKLLWLKNKKPEVYNRSHKIMLLEDFLVYKLSGKCVSNPALMCSTGYYDIVENKIWMDILSYCSFDAGKIPEVRACGTVVGTLKPEIAALLGLPDSVVVTTGAMDQVTSAIGSVNINEGVVTETTGTCQVVAATCSSSVLSNWSPITVYSHALEGKYLMININQTAGIALKWFRDEFCVDIKLQGADNAFKKMDELAAKEPPLSRGLTFFPYLTGMQVPIANANARGVFFGVGLDTNRACFIRAILESVGYTLKESIELMGLTPKLLLSLGGGSKSPLWNQIKADICNADILVMQVEESTSLGAAILGSVACGVFDNIQSACATLKSKHRYTPNVENVPIYEKGYQKYKSMYERFAPLF